MLREVEPSLSSTKRSFPASAFLVVLDQPDTVTVEPMREGVERSCGGRRRKGIRISCTCLLQNLHNNQLASVFTNSPP